MIEHERRGWVDAFTWRLGRLAMALPALIVCIMLYEVFMRYMLERPTIWVNELSLWMAGWIYLIAGVYSMQQRSHIRITILYDICPLWLRRVFKTLSAVFVVAWAAATVYGGFNGAQRSFLRWETVDSAWAPPIPATTKPLVLIIMVLMTVQVLSNLIMDWKNMDDDKVADSELLAEIEELKRAQMALEEKELAEKVARDAQQAKSKKG